MIRTSKHFFNDYLNVGKSSTLSVFLDECERMFNIILDDIWENGYYWEIIDKNTNEIKQFEFNPKFKKLETPKFIDYKKFSHYKTILSARALNDVVAKLCGTLSASVEKQRKRLYQLQNFKKNKIKKDKFQKLIKKVNYHRSKDRRLPVPTE